MQKEILEFVKNEGIEIGKFKNKLDLDTDWRRTSTSTWEAYIGLGLHY